MSTIIAEGILFNPKEVNGKVAFNLSENTGSVEKPNYVVYQCLGYVPENLKQYLTDKKIVEVIGDLHVTETIKEDKKYTNLNVYFYKIKLRGEIKSKNE